MITPRTASGCATRAFIRAHLAQYQKTQHFVFDFAIRWQLLCNWHLSCRTSIIFTEIAERIKKNSSVKSVAFRLMLRKPRKIDTSSEEDVLTDFVLPEPSDTTPPTQQSLPAIPLPVEGTPFGIERRNGERRQSVDRRVGLRGHWEDRRMFDRRYREYSIFGKRLDGADERKEANPLALAEVPLSEIISPAELRILAEEEHEANKKRSKRGAANSLVIGETIEMAEGTEVTESTKAKTEKSCDQKASGDDILANNSSGADSSQAALL